MICGRCGKDIRDEVKFCPECGMKVEVLKPSRFHESGYGRECINNDIENMIVEDRELEQEYVVEGVWRGTNMVLHKMPSHIVCRSDSVSITTKLGFKREKKESFKRRSIKDISFKSYPIWRISYIISIFIFALLMYFTCGLSILGILLVVKLMYSRHMVIALKNKKKIKVPIKQDSDVIPVLYDLGWQQAKIREVENKRISEKKWMFREFVVFILLWLLTGLGILFGLQKYMQKIDSEGETSIQMEVPDRTVEVEDIEESTQTDEARDSSDTVMQGEKIASSDEFSYYEGIISDMAAANGGIAYYTLYDLDNDGIRELIVSAGTSMADWNNTIFVLNDGLVSSVCSFYGSSSYYIAEDNNGIYSVYASKNQYQEIRQITKQGSQVNVEIISQGTLEEGEQYYSNNSEVIFDVYEVIQDYMYMQEDLVADESRIARGTDPEFGVEFAADDGNYLDEVLAASWFDENGNPLTKFPPVTLKNSPPGIEYISLDDYIFICEEYSLENIKRIDPDDVVFTTFAMLLKDVRKQQDFYGNIYFEGIEYYSGEPVVINGNFGSVLQNGDSVLVFAEYTGLALDDTPNFTGFYVEIDNGRF